MIKGWQGLLFSGAILLAGCQHVTSEQSGIRVMTAEGRMRQHIVATETIAALKCLGKQA